MSWTVRQLMIVILLCSFSSDSSHRVVTLCMHSHLKLTVYTCIALCTTMEVAAAAAAAAAAVKQKHAVYEHVYNL
jgi:hypothetical protein